MVDEKSDAALFTAAHKGGTGVCIDLWETRRSTTRRLDGALLNGRRTEGRRRRPVCPGVKGTPILILCWVVAGVRHSPKQ